MAHSVAVCIVRPFVVFGLFVFLPAFVVGNKPVRKVEKKADKNVILDFDLLQRAKKMSFKFTLSK